MPAGRTIVDIVFDFDSYVSLLGYLCIKRLLLIGRRAALHVYTGEGSLRSNSVCVEDRFNFGRYRNEDRVGILIDASMEAPTISFQFYVNKKRRGKKILDSGTFFPLVGLAHNSMSVAIVPSPSWPPGFWKNSQTFVHFFSLSVYPETPCWVGNEWRVLSHDVRLPHTWDERKGPLEERCHLFPFI